MTGINHDHQLADDEIIALLQEMLDSGELGVYPYYNDNGADSYECPSCGGSRKIKGHACGYMPLSSGEHTEDCNLMKLANMLLEDTPATEAIITLVEEMFASEEIGVYPLRNNNGADSYECQACGGSEKIKGYAFGQMHLSSGNHEKSCNALKLYRAITNRETD